MFRFYRRIKNITYDYSDYFFDTLYPIMHIDNAVQNNEEFLTVIGMSLVWLISTMKARRNSIHIGDGKRLPCTGSRKFFR
jgi:hypothetical protein